MKEFGQLSTMEELKEFLETKGKGHKWYFHYTPLDTLQKMLGGRKLHLTRMDKLNDARECNAAVNRKKLVYVASFSFGTAESMAMWSMYGAPYKSGIRLTIPGRAITKLLKDFEKDPVVCSAKTGKRFSCKGTPVLKIMDVVYAHPFSLERCREKLLRKQGKFVVDAKNDPELAFYVKNEIWLSENETRIVLELENELPGNEETIAIDFGSAVDELEVTGSPCLDPNELKRQLKNFEEGKIHRSIAYNQVYFNACEDCDQKSAYCKANKKTKRHE